MADGVEQMMWPDHCVQESAGAEFHKDLNVLPGDFIVKKGKDTRYDSYSAFMDNGGHSKTEMEALLKERGVDTVYVTGLASEYCVNFTCLDAVNAGFKTFLVEDAARGITPADVEKAKAALIAKGVTVVQAKDVAF